jgi:hypothetical protein
MKIKFLPKAILLLLVRSKQIPYIVARHFASNNYFLWDIKISGVILVLK